MSKTRPFMYNFCTMFWKPFQKERRSKRYTETTCLPKYMSLIFKAEVYSLQDLLEVIMKRKNAFYALTVLPCMKISNSPPWIFGKSLVCIE